VRTAESIHPNLRAAFWMLGTITGFTSMAVAGRIVRQELDTFELMMFRSFVGIIVVVSFALITRTTGQIVPRKLGLHFLRNAFHFTGQNLWFFALPLIPLANLFALEFSTPVWVVLLAPFLLGERLTRIRALSAALGFLGVIIVARPDPSNLDIGTIAAALAAIGFAGTSLFTKKLTRTESTISILFWLTVMQAIMAMCIVFFDGNVTMPSAGLIVPVILVGLAGLMGHFCLTRALTLAPAGIVMPMDFLRLPVAAVVGIIVYSEALHPTLYIGGAIILASNFLNIRAKSAKS